MMNTKLSFRIWINLSLFFGASFLSFGVAELACRLFYDESANYQKEVWHRLRRMNPSELVGLAHIEGKTYIDTVNGLEYAIATNSLYEPRYLQFDAAKISRAKAANTFRVAVVGDSFAVGGGLGGSLSEYAFPKQLERMLNGSAGAGKRSYQDFEVLTFAESGLNTFQELTILKDLVLRYNPDLIILQFCDNDIEDIRSEMGFVGSRFYIRSKTPLLFVSNTIVPALPHISKNVNLLMLGHSVFFRFLSYKLNILFVRADSRNAWDACFESLQKMVALAKSRKIHFLIVNLPLAYSAENSCSQTPNDSAGRTLHEKLRRFSSELGVLFLTVCDNLTDIRSIGAFDSGGHYNKDGHRLTAEILKNAVMRVAGKKPVRD